MKAEDVLRAELIGRRVEVIDACNRSLRGLAGVVVDETTMTLVLDTLQGRRRVLKRHVRLAVDVDGARTVVSGVDLAVAPDERIKTKVKR